MESLTKVTVGQIKPAKVSPSTPFVPLAPGGRPQDDASAARVAARAARESYGKLVAFLAAPGRDVPGAEDALSEAFASALENWPTRGVPDNPEGWLVVAARRRMLDFARRRRGAEAASDALAMIGEELETRPRRERRSPTGASR